jgi:hypothetical protein
LLQWKLTGLTIPNFKHDSLKWTFKNQPLSGIMANYFKNSMLKA